MCVYAINIFCVSKGLTRSLLKKTKVVVLKSPLISFVYLPFTTVGEKNKKYLSAFQIIHTHNSLLPPFAFRHSGEWEVLVGTDDLSESSQAVFQFIV